MFYSTVGTYALTNNVFGLPDAGWGFPVYNASGAGPANRAYLDWTKHSALYGIGSKAAHGDILNVAGTAQGYTMEAYLRFDGNLSANNLPPIGASVFGDFSSKWGNNFINITGWSTHSNTSAQTFDAGGTKFSDNMNYTGPGSAVLPYGYDGRWVHLVKTHEISGGQSIVRWYRNGSLVTDDSTIDAASDAGGPYLSKYVNQSENFGEIGDANARTLRYFGYSFFRVYRGSATAAEVSNLYQTVAQPVGLIDKIVDFDVNAPGAYSNATHLLYSTVGGFVLTNTEWGLSGGNPGYGFATYTASGAGPRKRAYLTWSKLGGMVGVSGKAAHGSVLNIGGCAQGYTMEAYFRFSTNFFQSNLAPIGANVFGDFSSKWGNNFINITGWSTHSNSSAQTYDPNGTKLSDNRTDPNSVLFPDGYDGKWVHIVKTHEVTDGRQSIVRWYRNNELVLTDSTVDSSTDGNGPYITKYIDCADDFGSVGEAGGQRSVRSFDYSLFRVYRGAATADQVATLYNQVWSPPPGTVIVIQ
jgi:hypothetical protein